jgi:cytochrome c-type biogenesis protein CcmE
MSTRRGKRALLVIGSLFILSGFGYLIYGGLASNIVYFLTPSELQAKGNAAYGTAVRLGGMVVPGSVKWDADALDLRFVMSDNAHKVTVHSRKAPPQMFREGMGVVVEGKLNRSGVFESSNVMVKHSNEYKAPMPGQKPQDVYKSLVRDEKGGQ